MQGLSFQHAWRRTGSRAARLALVLFLSSPQRLARHGEEAGTGSSPNKAVDTLPQGIREFLRRKPQLPCCSMSPIRLDVNRGKLRPSGTITSIALEQVRAIFRSRTLPRDYKAAVTKFGKSKLEANGPLLPWQNWRIQ